MKKLLILFSIVAVLFTACVNTNPPLDGTSEKTTSWDEATTSLKETAEQPTDSEFTTDTPSKEKPLYTFFGEAIEIYNLNDFYTLLTTKSSNVDDYETTNWRLQLLVNQLNCMPTSDILVKLEDLGLKSRELLNGVHAILVHTKTVLDANVYAYEYYLKDSIIRVVYYPERYPTDFTDTTKVFESGKATPMEGGLSACIANQNKEHYYTEFIDNCLVSYSYNEESNTYRVVIIAEGFWIRIILPANAQDQLSDPTVSEIAKFFCEDTYLDAVQQAIDGIKNRD